MFLMIETILIEGFIYGIMVLGLFISYRTLNFCDMTVDGAFPMGGCILAACLTHGFAPSVGILMAFLGGCAAGLCRFGNDSLIRHCVPVRRQRIVGLLCGHLVNHRLIAG